MLSVESEINDGLLHVKIKGKATIEYIAEIKEKLTQIIDKAQGVVLDLEDVKEADLSFLQIITSLYHSLKSESKEFSLKDKKAPNVLIETMKKGGYSLEDFFAYGKVETDVTEEEIHKSKSGVG